MAMAAMRKGGGGGGVVHQIIYLKENRVGKE